jgi:hypothetical protein
VERLLSPQSAGTRHREGDPESAKDDPNSKHTAVVDEMASLGIGGLGGKRTRSLPENQR